MSEKLQRNLQCHSIGQMIHFRQIYYSQHTYFLLSTISAANSLTTMVTGSDIPGDILMYVASEILKKWMKKRICWSGAVANATESVTKQGKSNNSISSLYVFSSVYKTTHLYI